jgi:hypothetical protein
MQLTTTLMFTPAGDLRYITCIPAVFAAILLVIRYWAITSRVRASILISIVSHLETPSFLINKDNPGEDSLTGTFKQGDVSFDAPMLSR